MAIKCHLKTKQVGLLDADIFGPSIPKMLNLEGVKPEIDDNNRIIPLVSHGLKCMSIGSLVDNESAMVWRGLMVMSAIQKLLRQVSWGPLHTLVVDMPPGTGDVQLSICQDVNISGSIIVTTPQSVATSDAHRGISMLKKLGVPIYGIVENMSEFICSACGNHEPLFASKENPTSLSGGELLAEKTNLSFLARIPIATGLVIAGDSGIPMILTNPQSPVMKIYDSLAENIIKQMQNKA